MANYCYNSVRFADGTDEERKVLFGTLADYDEDRSGDLLNLFDEMPKELEIHSELSRQWAEEHWGTDLTRDICFEKEVLHFKSRYAPPVPALINLSRQYPHILIIHIFVREGYWDEFLLAYRAGKILANSCISNDIFETLN